jgi:putative N6-adenine-specific DNA methylase
MKKKLLPMKATNRFFIVVPPYFERLALYELQGALAAFDFSLGEYEIHAGGIELDLPLRVGLSLNSKLKIPTRILMRLETREILSFKELETFFKGIQWKSFGPLREVYVSSRSSKMKIKEAIKESFKKTIPFKPQKNGTDVYIRLFRDQCTISVDTSGEDLFQRGQEKWVGEAPIRDNMAAGLLQMALQGTDSGEGWEIVDPMMGSGTFLTEAAALRSETRRPFAFQNWTGDYKIQPVEFVKQNVDVKLVGRDIDAKNVEIARKNLAQAGADLKTEDLFSKGEFPSIGRRRLVVLNPPYGKRLKIKNKNFFQDVVDSIREKYSPDRLALIVPRGAQFDFAGYEKLRQLDFSNNGIDVEFYLLLRRQTN